jgi:hypothetical protein
MKLGLPLSAQLAHRIIQGKYDYFTNIKPTPTPPSTRCIKPMRLAAAMVSTNTVSANMVENMVENSTSKKLKTAEIRTLFGRLFNIGNR